MNNVLKYLWQNECCPLGEGTEMKAFHTTLRLLKDFIMTPASRIHLSPQLSKDCVTSHKIVNVHFLPKKKNWPLKCRTFNFKRLIFGHSLSYFGHKFSPTEHAIRLKQHL